MYLGKEKIKIIKGDGTYVSLYKGDVCIVAKAG